MKDANDAPSPQREKKPKASFLHDLLITLLRDFMYLVFAFLIGTAAAALACLIYDLPLILSLFGGILVLGIGLFMRIAPPFD